MRDSIPSHAIYSGQVHVYYRFIFLETTEYGNHAFIRYIIRCKIKVDYALRVTDASHEHLDPRVPYAIFLQVQYRKSMRVIDYFIGKFLAEPHAQIHLMEHNLAVDREFPAYLLEPVLLHRKRGDYQILALCLKKLNGFLLSERRQLIIDYFIYFYN